MHGASASEIPRVGVGVFILNEKNEFIFGLRKGAHGTGTWALPGGHLELYETFEDCAKREILEEIGVEIKDVQYLTSVESPRIDGTKHYITVFMVARPTVAGSQPQLLEPNKCEVWRWISWETMLEWYEENAKRSVNDEGKRGNTLFMPMMGLVEQRPGIKPLLTFN